MQLAVFEPDIPQNLGSALRLAACMGVRLNIIEPCGFLFDDKRIRRAGMDYIDLVDYTRYDDWDAFLRDKPENARVVLLTTKGATSLPEFQFQQGDILLLGRESAGVPSHVAEAADARVKIPMAAGARSLNVVISAAIALTEALRQTGQFPKEEA